MKKLIFILMFMSFNLMAEEDGLGQTHLGIDGVFTSTLKSGYDYEKFNSYKDISLKLGQTIHLSSYFDLDSYVGYAFTTTKIDYLNLVDQTHTYKNDSLFFQINPLWKTFDSAYFGLYAKTYFKNQKMTDTELYQTKFGVNTQLQTNPKSNVRIGFFYDQTSGTTNKKIQSSGISFQINW